MSEYLWEYNACGQDANFYLIHRVISESAARSGVDSTELSLISQSRHVDMLRVQCLGIPREQWEGSEFTNPHKRVKSWRELPDFPPDEIRVETPKGVCRLFNLGHAF
jgi:hypothetical protein